LESNPEHNPLLFLSCQQHYLTAFGSTISVPLILSGPLCLAGDDVGLGYLMGTIFVVSGIATIMQATLGIR
jgi:nucleobase transporter 1/2